MTSIRNFFNQSPQLPGFLGKNAGSKYTALAKEAPNEEAKKKLLEMAKQEIMHKATLECLLLDVNNDSNAVK